jgi:hypothetical protein
MGFPRVLLADGRVDPSLGGHGVAADRVDLREEGHIQVRWCGDRGPHSSEPGPDNQDVMRNHGSSYADDCSGHNRRPRTEIHRHYYAMEFRKTSDGRWR